MAIDAFAPAKINLTLHITGRRADGYHLLDSLVAFAGVGDTVTAGRADQLSLRIDGPMAAGLSAGEDNLVLRAARLLAPNMGAALRLTKRLPVASGIGGGSADAAATLRALAELWTLPLPDSGRVLSLGADVPVCLDGRPARMSGVGEIVEPLAAPLPQAWLVLANPGVAVSTPAVFAALERRDNPPMPDRLPDWPDAAGLAAFLIGQRNDMEAAAIRLLPVIADVKAALAAQPGCLVARMSGSGATCFGLFEDAAEASAAAGRLQQDHPGWWVAPAPLLRS
ncbi:4-(cytidine 5'-diphospho)-2-C-methyl-D-erythritol kinase [Tabrizicola sp. J26]|uniref:4-(cytidine 5'-diphospho)-2-C-methyl-D-erythritol kinase n=1 Tax=Alitabrizicola rongguiensis TaxID=2909234 RepID=UPI001F1B35B5|nr:4-(cytidine 5'-diphospho)-2-C-methyl-D-erythritol kinase [Tabrizicola rongguiensis]MCF1708074.1 4-(cytidine 5'-diphospho)-2-C-methyl-D-erythritol kinase [Tabrizicola rongguiensis]